MNRLHFLLGAMGYVASLLWLLMLLASTAYVVLPSLSADPLLGDGARVFRDWFTAWRQPRQLVPLLGVTIALLFGPKLLTLVLALARYRESFGGAGRLLLSALLEMLFAAVIAPLMMIYHSRFVLSVLSGHDIKWDPQVRDGREVAWPDAWRQTVGVTAAGCAWAGLTLYASPIFFLWLTPIFAGLLLAAPLVRWTSSRSLGLRARHLGLFLVSSETAPLPELKAPRWSVPAAPTVAPQDSWTVV